MKKIATFLAALLLTACANLHGVGYGGSHKPLRYGVSSGPQYVLCTPTTTCNTAMGVTTQSGDQSPLAFGKLNFDIQNLWTGGAPNIAGYTVLGNSSASSSAPSALTTFPPGFQFWPQTPAEQTLGITPVNYLDPVGMPDRYEVNTTPGTTVMLTGVQDAFKVVVQQGGGAVTFSPEQYYLGSFASPSPLIVLTNPTNIVVYGNGGTIVVNTQAGANLYQIFQLQNLANFTVIGLNFTDTGGNEQTTWDGAWAWNLVATGSTNSGGFSIVGGTYTGIVAPVDANWSSGVTGRIRGIHLNYRAVNCYYGGVLADQGDGATGSITVINARRSFFLYGVSGADITVNAFHDSTTNTGGSDADILVSRYEFDTRGDRIHVVFHGFGTYAGPPVVFQTNEVSGTQGITSFGSITGGSAYANGVYFDVPLTGGTGTGAIADIQVSGGAVIAVQLVNSGSGYAVSDALSASASNIGGTGSGFSVPVLTVGASIADVSVDLSLADYSMVAGQSEVVTFNSLTSGGAEQSPTPDRFDKITISGTFGAWPTFGGFPIFVESTQETPGRISLSGPLLDAININGQTFPGFVATSGTSILGPYTVSTLPTCNAISLANYTARVTDATSPVYNGTLTGGGAVKVPVFCNGSAWTAH